MVFILVLYHATPNPFYYLYRLRNTPMTLSNTHSVPSATKSVSMPYLKPLTVHSVHFNPAGNINQTYTSSFHTPDKTFQIVMITRQCVSVCGFCLCMNWGLLSP